MKPQTNILPLLIALLCSAGAGNAQSRSDIPGFLAAAGDAGREMALLTPSIQKVNDASAYVPLIAAARKLATKVLQTGPKMTGMQYESLQRELAAIESDLDKLLGAPGGSCPKSCRDGFGEGYAGSKGWNRFVCKLGCIKIKAPTGKSGG